VFHGQEKAEVNAHLARMNLAVHGLEGNIRIANPSTAAQYFHLLRRQALIRKPRPLIVFTPKGLLRADRATASLEDLTDGELQFILDDPKAAGRREKVERFQHDADCKLFLISLKAGGVGLNLTAADYVFILDPWWNPAVEAQAVDRAHRIGQTRPVFAYRLIARGTVEEKILELQEGKRELADAILTADQSLIKNLSPDDLRFLLS